MGQVPTQHRLDTYERDRWMCQSCGLGAREALTFQHRQAIGMGGMSKFRTNALLYSDGLTACGLCNADYERGLQVEALMSGWKVARFIKNAFAVPVMEKPTGSWFRLDRTIAERVEIDQDEAKWMMQEAYGDYLARLISRC